MKRKTSFPFAFCSLIRTFAAEMVMHGCFIRAIKGNQVKDLSSTRYCDPYYGKSRQSHWRCANK
jgi:hypothetical protein